MPNLLLECSIEEVQSWYPYLFLEPHVVACVAILSRYSSSPAQARVYCQGIESDWLGGETEFTLEVSWGERTAEKASRLRQTIQSKPLVEMAASALAFAVAHRVLALGQVDVTVYGERADYRSLDPPCVLEISGTETSTELPRRHREKALQALANPFSWDAYVAVAAFSARGHQIRLSFHRQQEA